MNSNVTLTAFTENQNQPKYDVISLTMLTSRWLGLHGGYFKLHNMKEIGGHNSMFINFRCRIVLNVRVQEWWICIETIHEIS